MRRRTTFAAYVPPCIAPWATPGVTRSSSCPHGCTAASPTTKISGWPGTVRSPSTMTRPLRSVVAPAASATLRAKDDAWTPAPHKTVRAGMISSGAFGSSVGTTWTDRSSMAVTRVPTRTSTPSRSSWRRADADWPGGYGGSTRSIASTRMIRASAGSIARKLRRRVSRAISPSEPASSTPVGPPPTSTNVIHSRRRSGSASRSAASNAMRIRRRISVASSMVLRPGATCAHSSWPK